jgi:hypothetical protein
VTIGELLVSGKVRKNIKTEKLLKMMSSVADIRDFYLERVITALHYIIDGKNCEDLATLA